MLVGAIVWLLCGIATSILLGKLEKVPVVGGWLDRQSGDWAGAYVIFGFIVVPVLVANFVEYLAWPFETDVATFSESGDLVYHPWGLWTPPGREVVNFSQGYFVYLNNGNKHPVVLTKGNVGYRADLLGRISVENPKIFFLKRERRHQDSLEHQIGKLKEEPSLTLQRFLTFNLSEVEAVFERECQPEQSSSSPEVSVVKECRALTDLLEQKVNSQTLADNGLKVKISIDRAESFVTQR